MSNPFSQLSLGERLLPNDGNVKKDKGHENAAHEDLYSKPPTTYDTIKLNISNSNQKKVDGKPLYTSYYEEKSSVPVRCNLEKSDDEDDVGQQSTYLDLDNVEVKSSISRGSSIFQKSLLGRSRNQSLDSTNKMIENHT